MKRAILAVMVLILCSGMASAQSGDVRRGHGYVFGGIGAAADDGAVALFFVGGGGEGLIKKGLGLGAEIGYVGALENGGEGVGLFSTNVSYHFGGEDPSRKLVPFVTGGYSLAFRESSLNGGNFGGGVQYWISDRAALRFEFRDHVFSSDSPHVVSFRVGLSFR